MLFVSDDLTDPMTAVASTAPGRCDGSSDAGQSAWRDVFPLILASSFGVVTFTPGDCALYVIKCCWDFAAIIRLFVPGCNKQKPRRIGAATSDNSSIEDNCF